MKNAIQMITLTILFILGNPCAWALDFQEFNSIAFDSTQHRFIGVTGNKTQWVVMSSSDSGHSWTILDQFEKTCRGLVSGYPCLWPTKIIFKAPHTLVTIGGMTESKYLDQWVVRWSLDGGKSWNMQTKSFGKFPIYAISIEERGKDSGLFNIEGLVTGFSSYRMEERVFNITTGQFED